MKFNLYRFDLLVFHKIFQNEFSSFTFCLRRYTLSSHYAIIATLEVLDTEGIIFSTCYDNPFSIIDTFYEKEISLTFPQRDSCS